MARRGTRTGRQQLEASIEAGRDLVHVERAQACRRQLDRQRQPVETTDDLGDARPLGGIGVELRIHGARPLHEQIDSRPVVGRRERRHHVQLLAGHPQPLAAGRDDRHVRTGDQETIDEIGNRVEDVLAVVEQQQHLGLRQHRRQSIGQHLSGAAIDGQRGGDDVDGGLLAGGRQFAHHDGAVGTHRLQAVTGLDEEPGLADSAGPDQRQETPGLGQGDDLLHRRRSALERRDGEREPARRLPRCAVDTSEQLRLLSAQRRRRRDPELLGETTPEVVVHPQRLGVPARCREGRHQQLARPLAQRFIVGQRSELGDQPVGHASCEPALGSGLGSPDPQLGQGHRLGPSGVDVGKLGIRRSLPSLEDGVDRGLRISILDVDGTVDGIGQPVGVDVESIRRDVVARSGRLDEPCGQSAAEPGNVGLQRPDRVPRPSPRPQGLDRRIRRHHPATMEDQQGQQPALQRTIRGDIAPVAVAGPDRPEHLDSQPRLAHRHQR